MIAGRVKSQDVVFDISHDFRTLEANTALDQLEGLEVRALKVAALAAARQPPPPDRSDRLGQRH